MESEEVIVWEEKQPRLYNAYGWVAVSDAEEAQALREQGQKAIDNASLKQMVDVKRVLHIVWQTGVCLFLLFLAAVNGRFAFVLRKKRCLAGTYRGHNVYTVDGLPTPCLFGLFSPAIYLTPEVAADDAAKVHVLAHEYTHFRQGDHVWAVLRGVCLALHWYNPLVWLAAYLSRRDCELSCDEGAVRLLGEDRRADYGRTLVGLVARRTTPRDLACCATTMTGGKSALKERIALLVKHPRTTAWMACIVAAACIIFAVCTFTGAAEEAEEPEPDAPEENLPVEDEDLPNVRDLPTDWDWNEPVWVLDRIQRLGEYIFIYQDAETGVNYLRKGDYLQKLETRNMYDRQGLNDIELTCRDLDGDGAEEIAVVYHVTSASGVESRELLICDWDGQRWTEHHPEGIVSTLVRNFQENHEISTIWSDPGMGETPGPSILSVNWDGLSAAFEVSPWLEKTGGALVSVLDEEQYTYHVDQDGGIELVIYGEASYADSPVRNSRQFWYACPVAYRADGAFAAGRGALNTRPPEDLPTELMDLSRPAEEQGPWLLLAQAPTTASALYRSAWDDQHVYLQSTNESFQAFDRDLSGMELLPTLDLWHGDADYAVEALYRRYEGTYFNGTSYEPGVVAEQAIYLWSSAGKFWTEAHVTPSVGLKTEDLPAIADLPRQIVGPGMRDDTDMWLIGEVPEADIAVYYERSGEDEWKTWLRYGSAIQAVEGTTVCLPQLLLPELYWEDFDGDGDRELAAISVVGHGTGVSIDQLTVYDWTGEKWIWATHDLQELIENFNQDLDLVYEFYEDGTAFIKTRYSSILLDLSGPWEDGYWGDTPPDKCVLGTDQVFYTCQDGQLTLTILGELLKDGSPYYLHGYTFKYVCPVGYMELGGAESYLGSGSGVLRSEFAVEPEPPELTDTWRSILEKTWAECGKDYSNRYAVHDVDGDGEEELIVIWYSLPISVYSETTSVYNAAGKHQFGGFGELTFYSNGAISMPWSHNQGAACAMWPYDLYRCIPPYFIYSKVGSARARSDDAPGFEDVAYADLDGDGLVYYIENEEDPVDNAVYEAWRNKYLAGAQVLPVQYFPLTEETISK